jgi:hypothetical protein
MPSLADLQKAREEFKRIEPRDFFYWSVTKLVSAVLEAESRTASATPGMVDELVRVLMMLLTTWNKNYYRFFNSRHPGMTLEEHFSDLETEIKKHFPSLIAFRGQRLYETPDLPEHEIEAIFTDFADVLGRVGAAKCLHLLAPCFFPLWDAAILKGYGMEKAEYRNLTDAKRYLAFIGISKAQIDSLGDFRAVTGNPLKALDEYNYCRFTKEVSFD